MERTIVRRLVLLSLAVGLSVSLGALAGCNKKSPPGGPAGTPEANTRDGFQLKVPATRTTLEPGTREEVTISIDRDGNFNQPVDLEFKAPPDVTVEPTKPRFEPNDKEVKVMIEASPDAKPGEASIEVVGKPETGASTSTSIPIEVKAKT